ncbi:MAG: hypothetical protein O8C64_04815 [Candidatus Methanoperedens sp.]|nr:hypothetical protein [Candidatus Methanoperedens sp.]MCZ7405500.1 hypothetical protein [Candidatus Methanoperedens sp.]
MAFKHIAVIAGLIVSILFAGCLSENAIKTRDTAFDIKPSELTMKNGETGKVMIRVTNNGKSIIYPVARFSVNSSDSHYVNFTPESYDFGALRPDEDSGFRIVEIRATLAAGTEIKYPAKVELVYNNTVIEGKEIIITVKG